MPSPSRRSTRRRSKQTDESSPSPGQETPQAARQESAASTSYQRHHTSAALAASADVPASCVQAPGTLSSPLRQRSADRSSDGQGSKAQCHELSPLELPQKRRPLRGAKTKKAQATPKQSKVGASGSSSNPLAFSSNVENARAGSSKSLTHKEAPVAELSTASTGTKEAKSARTTRSSLKSTGELHVGNNAASKGVGEHVHAKEAQQTPSYFAAKRLRTKNKDLAEAPGSATSKNESKRWSSGRRGRPPKPARQGRAAKTTSVQSSHRGDVSETQGPPTSFSFARGPETSGQRVTRALARSQTREAMPEAVSKGTHENDRTGGRASGQQGSPNGGVTKTPRANEQRKKVHSPENRADEATLASAKRKAPVAMPSPAPSGPEAASNSSWTSIRRRLLFDEQGASGSTLLEGTENVKENAHALKHQRIADDAKTGTRNRTLRKSLGVAKISSPAHESSSTENARALPHGLSKKGAPAQQPTERRTPKRPSAETSNTEAEPTSSEAKNTRTQSSSQEESQSPGSATTNRKRTSRGSVSHSVRSRTRADSRGGTPSARPVPKGTAGTESHAPEVLHHKTDREKLRARPRHFPKRKFTHEPVFVLDNQESSRQTASPSSRDNSDTTLSVSPSPTSASTLSFEDHAGKLGFHWYEATFGTLLADRMRARGTVGKHEESDNDIESLHWTSDTECSADASHEASDGGSLHTASVISSSNLPWDDDEASAQISEDWEPGQKVQRLDHWQKDVRRKVQMYLPGVEVTKKAWDTIDKWQDHFLERMGQSVEAMATRFGHDRIEEKDVIWFIHRYLGTADPVKLWALADKLLPAELRQRIYPATQCILACEEEPK